MDAGTAIVAIFIIILLAVLAFVIIHLTRTVSGRKQALRSEYGYLPSHTELYFEEYFPAMISEWDLMTKPKLEPRRKAIQEKLKTVSTDIKEILGYRKDLDSRLENLEKEVGKLEKK